MLELPGLHDSAATDTHEDKSNRGGQEKAAVEKGAN
jgi:hypothetical protein